MQTHTMIVSGPANTWQQEEGHHVPDEPMLWCRAFDSKGSHIEFHVPYDGSTCKSFYESLFDGNMPSRTLFRKRCERKEFAILLFAY
jgi:hypothetical protein